MLAPDDSLRLNIDLFGYLGLSRAGALRAGEPLGAGGKPSLYFNQQLYAEAPADRPHLEHPDLRPGYGDFSYVPLWQSDQAELRMQYRFWPRIWGSLSLAYSAEPTQIEAEDALHAPQLEEMILRWAPEAAPELGFTLGSLDITGTYCPLFDHFPMEHFDFQGVQSAFHGARGVEIYAAAGAEAIGRIKRTVHGNIQDLADPNTSTLLDGQRLRGHLVGGLRRTWDWGLSLGAMAGYQALPKDSAIQMPLNAAVRKYRWPASQGWQAGAEIGWTGAAWSHDLVIVRGEGDVKMAWSAPDPIAHIERTPPDVEWGREGSALTQAVYWGAFKGARGAWHLDWAGWMQWRAPSSDSGYPYATGRTGPDSIATLRPQRFRALKVAIEPSAHVAGWLWAGARYDGFRYFDPEAHANTQEPQTDQALRGIPDPNATDGALTFGPSKWEREAVDCNILSPYLQAELQDDFHVRAVWSGAWYGKPVWRQGKVGGFHANFTLAAWLTYRFGSGKEAGDQQRL